MQARRRSKKTVHISKSVKIKSKMKELTKENTARLKHNFEKDDLNSDTSMEFTKHRKLRQKQRFLQEIKRITATKEEEPVNEKQKAKVTNEFNLFDKNLILDFVDKNKFRDENAFGKWDYFWNKKIKEIKKFVPKVVRKAVKDKHGIVDGNSFFIHLFELRLFLQKMRNEVVFLAFKAENKFSAETKYLFVKMVLAILGKYVITPSMLQRKSLPSEMTLNDCLKADKRVFLIFKPNLLLEENAKVSFSKAQFDEVHIMDEVLQKTYFPVNECFRVLEELEKEYFDEPKKDEIAKKQEQSTRTESVLHSIFKEDKMIALKLIELMDKVILKSDKEGWTAPKTLNQWGIWNNKQVVFSKFHNTEDVGELFDRTDDQIKVENAKKRELFLINNLTLTLSKKKKQFLRNMINLNIPTLKNLFAKLLNKSSLHNYIFDLVKSRDADKPINIFKFDFVNKIEIISKLLVFANSASRIEIVHFLVYDKNRRNFLKAKLEDPKRFFSNGMFFVADLEKFLSELKKNLQKDYKAKLKLKNKIIVVFKIDKQLFLKYYVQQTSLLVRFHTKHSALPNDSQLRYSHQVVPKSFDFSEKDEVLDTVFLQNDIMLRNSLRNHQERPSGLPRTSNLFGDNWELRRLSAAKFDVPIQVIKEVNEEKKKSGLNHDDLSKNYDKPASKLKAVPSESVFKSTKQSETVFSRRW